MSDPNLNHLCARIAIDECVRRGCRTIVVCPGSRSAPLAAAAAGWRGRAVSAAGDVVDVLVAHDERGAAFLALGAARLSGRAAVVITTSGTAVANLLPAVVEASMDGIPMLLFTADRPPELHGCGANQSVPQSGMLEPVARAVLDIGCPDDDGATPIDALDAVADAWSHAHAAGGASGPVHVNWRFREPLAPIAARWSLPEEVSRTLARWEESGAPWNPGGTVRARAGGAQGHVPVVRQRDAHRGWDAATGAQVDALVAGVRAAARGVVVAGGARSPEHAADLARIARALHWPVIADITSGLRSDSAHRNVVHHADLVLCARTAAAPPADAATPERVRDALHPDMILRIGGRIASKRVQQWIDESASRGCMLAVADDGIEPMDPSRQAVQRVRVGARALADRITSGGASPMRSDVADAWMRADSAACAALASVTDGADPATAFRAHEPCVARIALREAHRAGALVMLSSSMPVRDADMHADRDATPWCIANRGASGIDGIVATAVGACRSSRRPVLLLIGDVAALHDLASWSMMRDLPAPMCVVVVNNDGGGIFRFLPIAEHQSIYSPWFDSPHGLSFGGAASMFSLGHAAVATDHDCARAIRDAWHRDAGPPSGAGIHRAHIVEVRTSASDIIPDHRAIQSSCAGAVRDALLAPQVMARQGQGSGG